MYKVFRPDCLVCLLNVDHLSSLIVGRHMVNFANINRNAMFLRNVPAFLLGNFLTFLSGNWDTFFFRNLRFYIDRVQLKPN